MTTVDRKRATEDPKENFWLLILKVTYILYVTFPHVVAQKSVLCNFSGQWWDGSRCMYGQLFISILSLLGKRKHIIKQIASHFGTVSFSIFRKQFSNSCEIFAFA